MSTVGLSYPKTSEVEYEEFVNIVLKNFKELDWIFSGKLDFKNIQAEGITTKNLDAEAVTAGKIAALSITTEKLAALAVVAGKIAADAIEADKIKAGAVETAKLAAGAVTADKITVTELSAIAADLGHITAGLIEAVEIIGSYIATSTGYPRIELSDTDNLLVAFASATNLLKIDADLTDPVINFDSDLITSFISNFSAFGSTFVVSTTGNMLLSSGGNMGMESVNGSITDVVAEINGKAPVFTGYSGTMIPGQTAVISNGLIVNVV